MERQAKGSVTVDKNDRVLCKNDLWCKAGQIDYLPSQWKTASG